MTCQCDICKGIVAFDEHLQAVPVKHHQYFEELYESFLDISNDLDYFRAVLSGEWPNGKEILEEALKKYDNE